MREPTIRLTDGPKGWEATVSFGTDPVTGKRVRRHIRATTRAALQTKIEEITATPPVSSDATPTLEAWMGLWLAALEAKASFATVDKAKWMVNNWLVPGFGRVKIDRLSPAMIEQRLATMVSPATRKTASPVTRWECYCALRTALNLAVQKQRIPVNPALNAVVPNPRRPEVQPLTPDETARILKVVEDRPDKARWMVGLLLGLRQSEVLGLTWDDIDLQRGTLSVTAQLAGYRQRHTQGDKRVPLKTKASRRTLPLPTMLADALTELRQTDPTATGWVFHADDGGCPDQRADGRMWKRLVKSAGITRNVRVHDMRHTAASALLAAGVPDRTAQEVMGWSGPAMTQRYQHPTSKVVAEAVHRGVAVLTGTPTVAQDSLRGQVQDWLRQCEESRDSVRLVEEAVVIMNRVLDRIS
ncbi:MAG: site-specific integrase [Propionibacteriaceae bacterium]|jgi:integrase|nr:site-specific integrase [Propionibacteriaceae bacterium]